VGNRFEALKVLTCFCPRISHNLSAHTSALYVCRLPPTTQGTRKPRSERACAANNRANAALVVGGDEFTLGQDDKKNGREHVPTLCCHREIMKRA
jgi:hypothetical protein